MMHGHTILKFMALWSVWICLWICCICVCVCTLCIHVYICSSLQLSNHITLVHETWYKCHDTEVHPTILLQFHVINIVNMTAVQNYGIWATWVPFKSQSLKCCALTNLRKYATVITVIFISRMKNKNILSDWLTRNVNSPEPLKFLLLNHKMDYTKNRTMLNRYMAYIYIWNVCVCICLCACMYTKSKTIIILKFLIVWYGMVSLKMVDRSKYFGLFR